MNKIIHSNKTFSFDKMTFINSSGGMLCKCFNRVKMLVTVRLYKNVVALIFPSILTSPYSPCALCWPAQVLHLGPSALRRSPCKPEWTLPSGLHDLVPHLWVIQGQTHVSDTGYVVEVVTDLFFWLVTCCIQVKHHLDHMMNRSTEIQSSNLNRIVFCSH